LWLVAPLGVERGRLRGVRIGPAGNDRARKWTQMAVRPYWV